jgi:hypothetical protein
MFNSYEMSQLAERQYFPVILEWLFIGIGELHPPEQRSRAGLIYKKISLNR